MGKTSPNYRSKSRHNCTKAVKRKKLKQSDARKSPQIAVDFSSNEEANGVAGQKQRASRQIETSDLGLRGAVGFFPPRSVSASYNLFPSLSQKQVSTLEDLVSVVTGTPEQADLCAPDTDYANLYRTTILDHRKGIKKTLFCKNKPFHQLFHQLFDVEAQSAVERDVSEDATSLSGGNSEHQTSFSPTSGERGKAGEPRSEPAATPSVGGRAKLDIDETCQEQGNAPEETFHLDSIGDKKKEGEREMHAKESDGGLVFAKITEDGEVANFPEEESVEDQSKSLPRLNLKELNQGPTKTEERSSVLLMELDQVNKVLRDNLVCQNCGRNDIQIKVMETHPEKKSSELVQSCCGYCEESSKEAPFVWKPKKKTPNRFCFAQGILSAGLGRSRANDFLSCLKVPPLTKMNFEILLAKEKFQMDQEFERMKDQAADVISKYFLNRGQKMNDGALDICVLFDNTCISSSASCHLCFSYVMEIETGLILDAIFAFQDCHSCSLKEKSLKREQFSLWRERHKASGRCSIDCKSCRGSSRQGAEALFLRSTKRNLRYTTLLLPEHSSFHKTLKQSYGRNHKTFFKLSFLDYFSKKTYSKLEAKIEEGSTLEGSLTKEVANAFANFYRVAVKGNDGAPETVRRTLMASVLHHASTDKVPLHRLCSRSWCRYRREAQEEGANTAPPAEGGWHRSENNNRSFWLNRKAAADVFDVLAEMAPDAVLEVLCGRTKSVNEPLLSKLRVLASPIGASGQTYLIYMTKKILINHNRGIRVATDADGEAEATMDNNPSANLPPDNKQERKPA